MPERAPAQPRQQGRRRARPQLDEDTILAAARELTATSTEPLTVRRLGQALGADPTAIYRRFRDKDELVRRLIDQLLTEIVAGDDPALPWRVRLCRLADATLEVFVAHPAVGAEAATKSSGGPGELAAINLILEALKDAGLGREDAVHYYGVYSSYVLHGAGAQARDRLERGGSPDDTYQDPWIGAVSLRTNRFPAVTEARGLLEQMRFRDIYPFGVKVILDAIEAHVPSRPTRASRSTTARRTAPAARR
jgi:AcrR family transcriptional regulator